MILGIGCDLTDIRRIQKTLKQQGARFEKRVFTEAEQSKAKSRGKAGSRMVAATYAKRFAAKEACVKALGKEGLSWLDMEITNRADGAPVLTLKGTAKQRLADLIPPRHKAQIHLTLTDSYPFAQAYIVISAVPK